MELKEIRREEQKTRSDKRKQKMTEAAFSCFCSKGIEAASIADIAREAEFGEATVYRYFTNKETLVLECGKRFWAMVHDFMERWTGMPEYTELCGMGQLEELIRGAYGFYLEHREAFRLLHNLDAFLMSHEVETEQLLGYEQAVDSLRPFWYHAMEKGKTDGSIRVSADVQELYYGVTTGILSMMEKQAAAGVLLGSDRLVDSDRKVFLFLELLIAGLKSSYGNAFRGFMDTQKNMQE